MKLIEGKQYLINGDIFTYDGIWEGHWCDRCGKARRCLAFIQGKRDNPTQVAKYGSECIKHIEILASTDEVK